MLIHGFSFDFCNEPKLNSETRTKNIIKVEEKEIFLDDFLVKKGSYRLSNQEAFYYAKSSFETKNEPVALEIKNIIILYWDSKNRNIFYQKKENYSSNRLRFWIFHTFFPFIIEKEEIAHTLHVGSVVIKNRATLFTAPSFGGKSTLTNYFLKQNHKLISDDNLSIKEIDNNFYAIPSYPFYRPYRKVESLGEYSTNFAQKPKRIETIFKLKRVASKEKVEIREIKGVEKFETTIYMSFIQLPFQTKRRFVFFTKMANALKIYEITIPWDKRELPNIYNQIINQNSR